MNRPAYEKRKENMQAVKSKDTGIEKMVRLCLYHKGYRYRKNYRKVFGNPDIVFIREKVAVFCDSEFWHGFDWANQEAQIKTNRDFWIPKISRNIERDIEVTDYLEREGWVVLRFWGKRIKSDLFSVINDIEAAVMLRRTEKPTSKPI